MLARLCSRSAREDAPALVPVPTSLRLPSYARSRPVARTVSPLLDAAARARRSAFPLTLAAALLLATAAPAAFPSHVPSEQAESAAALLASIRDYGREPAATRAAQRAAAAVAQTFIETAVRRSQTARSYPLVTNALRQQQTRAQWARGNIPVVPISNAVIQRAKLILSRPARQPTTIAWLLIVSGYSFRIDLIKHDHWQVNYWAPAPTAAWATTTP